MSIDNHGQFNQSTDDLYNLCPYCDCRLTPHTGVENGRTDSWAHPVNKVCKWSEFEGLTNRQIASVRSRLAKTSP